MHKEHHRGRRGYVLTLALGVVVLAFMGLSLAITATGTARFAVAMGYPPEVGYAVGGVFLPVGLFALLARREIHFFAIIGCAWLVLVTYSALATHATVTSAIASIERTGTWKMEVRSDTRAELDAVEKHLAVLSKPAPPRPATTVAEALASERVPPGVWRDSQACQTIRESRYFQTACAKVLALRRELVAAEDYERLDARARELREVLATAPIIATTDPLPEAFAATLGRVVPLDGNVGVALLLALVIEIMSCFGLAALGLLREEKVREHGRHKAAVALPGVTGDDVVEVGGEGALVTGNPIAETADSVLPNSSLMPATLGRAPACR